MCNGGRRKGRAALRANADKSDKMQDEVYENYGCRPLDSSALRGAAKEARRDGEPLRRAFAKRKINSRAKGQRGELEVRDLLRAAGFEAERGQQRAGGSDSPDVKHNIPGYHIEVKLCEQFNLFKALAQATADNPNAIPLIFHRRNKRPWMVCLPAEELLRLLRARGLK